MADELEVFDPSPSTITLSTGTVVEIEGLKTRQFFKLLRIITRGALPQLQDMSLFNMKDGEMDSGEFAGRLISLLLLSIPEAENEAIDFVQAMCRPVGLIQRRSGIKLNKQEVAQNTDKWAAVITELDNPSLDDLVSVIEAIVNAEAGDLLALGKRLRQMFSLAQKTGQLRPSSSPSPPASRDANYSAASVGHSTSSAASTGGTTTVSSTLLSDDSDRSQPPFSNDGSTAAGNAASG